MPHETSFKDLSSFENFHIDPKLEVDLSSDEKTLVSDDLVGFLNSQKSKFNEAHLHIHLKRHKEQFREKPLIHCRLNLTTDRGRFNASSEGWGVQNSVRNTLSELEFQIRKKFGKMETNATIRKVTSEEDLEKEGIAEG